MNLRPYYQAVKSGKTVTILARGSSMTGLINDKDKVTIEPCDVTALEKDDIVLSTVGRFIYIHKITAIMKRGNNTRFLIGNNKGHDNGWTQADNVVGIVTYVNTTPRGRTQGKVLHAD